MKLLFISGDTSLAQGKKGPFYYLLEEFSQYWDRIDIICPKTEQKIFCVHNNVFIHSSNKSRIFQPIFILKKGLEIYKKEKFDIFGVHSYPPFYNDIGGRWLHNKIKVPYVLEVMHITGYPKAGSFKEWFYKILTRCFIKFFAKRAKTVRVINQKQVPEFLIKSGVDKKNIKYIPAFYIDLETFKPREIEKPRTIPPLREVRGKKYDIVFSGRLVKNKGILLLLEAVKHLNHFNQASKVSDQPSPDRVGTISLIIIGDGSLKPKIEKYVRKNNLQKYVILAGWLAGIEDVAKIYNQSKIFVMPSFNEGGPRACLEAMACKIPVITTKVGIMIDIIKDWENGVFIDWDEKDASEKILKLLDDENLRKKIAENGYNTVQQFERKKAIKNYAKTYQNLLHSARI